VTIHLAKVVFDWVVVIVLLNKFSE
jgi:hypothetical protein